MKRINQPNAPRELICCCCGNPTIGRQWHNRDRGYGLCPPCAAWIRERWDISPEEFECAYGREGVHFNLSATAQPTEV